MKVRPSRVAGVVAGIAVVAGGITAIPAFAKPGSDADDARVSIAGSVPGWATDAAKVADVDLAKERTVHVALGLRDQAAAERLAKEISTPGAPNFRKPLSPQD